MIRIIIDRNCDLIDAAANLEMSRFINYYLFIKKTSNSALSAFYLDI